MNKRSSIDPARRVLLQFRIKRDGTLPFVFTENCEEVDITAWGFELFISRYPGDRKKIITLTLGDGLSIPVYEINKLEAFFTSDQTNIPEGQYYWELYRTDTKETWLNGYADFTYGPKDAKS